MSAGIGPCRRQDLRTRVLGEETVILDRRHERIHQLNRTAAAIWDRCDGQHTVAEIARVLTVTFQVEAAQAATDVGATIRELETLGLLEAPVNAR